MGYNNIYVARFCKASFMCLTSRHKILFLRHHLLLKLILIHRQDKIPFGLCGVTTKTTIIKTYVFCLEQTKLSRGFMCH